MEGWCGYLRVVPLKSTGAQTPALALNRTPSPHLAVIHSRTRLRGASVLLAGKEGLGKLTLPWGPGTW